MVSGAVVLTRIARLLTDVMQAEHAYSGCDIALWDALGKRRKTPVYKLLHSHFENARRYREMGRQFWCGCGSMAWQQATRARARAQADCGGERRYKPPTPWPKTPYASVLFEDTPEETRVVAERLRDAGYAVVKFGWGPMGPDLELDVALVREARAGLGAFPMLRSRDVLRQTTLILRSRGWACQ